MLMRKALFLDRDGVINVDHGYVCTPERTDFIDGIFDLCRAAKQRGYLIVVVTNQAGIARGYYSEQDFITYMDWMRGVFVEQGAPLDAVYYCPHHPTDGIGDYLQFCECRKPEPGMIRLAQRDLDLNLECCLLVGDKSSDIEAGQAVGVGSCFMVTATRLADSGHVAFDEHVMNRLLSALDGIEN